MKNNQILKICQRCNAKCCKMGGPNFTEKEMQRVLKKGYKNYFFEVRDGIYELKTKKGICPYLKKDNSCGIHDIKSLLCLCWPVFPDFDKRKGGYVIMECPVTKFLSKKDIEKSRKEASRVSKKLLDVALDYSTVPKSEAKLLESRLHRFKTRKLR